MATKLENLRTVRHLLTPPEHWVKGRAGVDADGNSADYPDAVAFCLIGACNAVIYNSPNYMDDAQALIETIREYLPPEARHSLITFNDAIATHADILALLDNVIKGESIAIE